MDVRPGLPLSLRPARQRRISPSAPPHPPRRKVSKNVLMQKQNDFIADFPRGLGDGGAPSSEVRASIVSDMGQMNPYLRQPTNHVVATCSTICKYTPTGGGRSSNHSDNSCPLPKSGSESTTTGYEGQCRSRTTQHKSGCASRCPYPMCGPPIPPIPALPSAYLCPDRVHQCAAIENRNSTWTDNGV